MYNLKVPQWSLSVSRRISFFFFIGGLLLLLLPNLVQAQADLSPEQVQKLKDAYSKIKNPEISFEKFAQINRHIYPNTSNLQKQVAVAAAPQDQYCNKLGSYCTNGDFESGLNQNQYTGAYGFWYTGLYPDPFNLTFGFSSGDLFDGNAHQTIVNKSAGADYWVGIPLTPQNGGSQSLRLGNAEVGNGTEIIAKTIVVDPNETILNFWYAVVLEDPGHPHDDQPAFSVRAYDCATGIELPNVCDLGNGSNIAVADANNPFFKSAGGGSLAYRDWSQAQINLSNYIGKKVIIVFTSKDCNFSGHFGYVYLDNLFSSKCPVGGTTDQGSVILDNTKVDNCGTGQICVKYTLPVTKDQSNNVTATGDIQISLSIFQNSNLTPVKTLNSPKFTSGNSYCFAIDPALLSLNSNLGAFDYVVTGRFTLNGFVLPNIIVGNPPTGQTAGINNDYSILCNVFYSKSSGDLHNVLTWGVNPDGSGPNPPDFTAGKTFNLSNRAGVYSISGNWTVGGTLVNPAGSQLQIGSFTLSIANLTGAGTLSGTTTSNLIVMGTSGGNQPLNFTPGSNNLGMLTINRSGAGAAATVSSALNIYNVLNVQNGTLNTGNLLTLKSQATTTARVAPVVGTINGTATVEQYIPARRAWRMINAPITGLQTIKQAWQENASSVTHNPSPGFGTHITGGSVFGSAVNGFDVNPTAFGSESSIKTYSNAINNWVPVSNTNMTPVGNTPFMLFVRGNRGINLNGRNISANTTTMRATGNLRTGDVIYNVNANGFTAIPNPYQSPINFATLTRNNVQNNFYLWDPKLGGANGVGGYVTVSWNGSSYDITPAPVSPESQYIQPWQSFLVRSTGSAGSITIKESDKVSIITGNVFRINNSTVSTPVQQTLRINLQVENEDYTWGLVDEILGSFHTSYSNKVDEMDIAKMPNLNENLSFVREGKDLTMERRGLISATDTLFLKVANTIAGTYRLSFHPSNLGSAVPAFLEDLYQRVSTPIQMDRNTEVDFSVTADPASQNPARFRVVFGSSKLLDASLTLNKLQAEVSPNPIIGGRVNIRLINQPQGLYTVSVFNGAGQVIAERRLQHPGGTAMQTIEAGGRLATGIYQVRIANGKSITTLKAMAE